MQVAITVQIISAIEKFLDFKFVFLRIANLIVDHSSSFHNDLVVEGAVLDIDLLGVS